MLGNGVPETNNQLVLRSCPSAFQAEQSKGSSVIKMQSLSKSTLLSHYFHCTLGVHFNIVIQSTMRTPFCSALTLHIPALF